ncbi:hypothetical protein RSOLAG22IIIB_09433 [Rhizoctonia solani]|uniref:Uncharacterized protein n=1 Tax=Rhizoctonia solani TaxID=456999 RepID=A0A0K6FYR7_9AGAM|nr:hypothetical protein RSOLAG22IIIB_09433 [Rhizoctonia solani]
MAEAEEFNQEQAQALFDELANHIDSLFSQNIAPVVDAELDEATVEKILNEAEQTSPVLQAGGPGNNASAHTDLTGQRGLAVLHIHQEIGTSPAFHVATPVVRNQPGKSKSWGPLHGKSRYRLRQLRSGYYFVVVIHALKVQCIYLSTKKVDGIESSAGVGEWIEFFNQ